VTPRDLLDWCHDWQDTRRMRSLPAMAMRVRALDIRQAGLLAALAECARAAGMDDVAGRFERVDRPDLHIVR